MNKNLNPKKIIQNLEISSNYTVKKFKKKSDPSKPKTRFETQIFSSKSKSNISSHRNQTFTIFSFETQKPICQFTILSRSTQTTPPSPTIATKQ